MVIIKFWAIFCFFNTTHSLNQWLQHSIMSSPFVYDVHQKLSSQELKTDIDKEPAEVWTKESYFTSLTPVENAGSKEETIPTLIDITYNDNTLVLTTAINVFRKEMATSDLNITQKDITNDFMNRPISKAKFIKKKHRVIERYPKSEDNYQGRDFTRSESDSREISSEEKHYRVHTPARRIFRGHKTKIKHFPFLVTVHVLGRFVCGGTIIKSDLVITAAHCLKRWQEWVHRTSTTLETTTYETTTDETTTDTITTDVISIDDIVNDVFGIDVIATGTDGAEFKSTNTNTDGTETTPTETETTDTTIITQQISSEDSGKSSSYETIPPKTVITEETSKPPTFGVLSVRIGTNYYRLEGKVVQVVNVYFHPSYDENNLQDNLVIMRLERHLNFKRRRVRKIEISTDASDVPEGTEVTIAGWGAKTYHNKVFNALWNLIHKAVLTVSPRDECVDTYTENFVTTTNFCALNEHHEGACNRDVGNPAVVDGLLVGVVSFGPPNCGQWDAPTVFTNVGYYADWIEEIMHMDLKSSSSSDENENRKKPTPETTTKCAGWTKATTTPELSEFDTPVYYDGNIYKDEKGWTTKATTTTELSGFDTPVYYDGNIYKDKKEQYNFPTRAYEDVKLRRRFSVVVKEKHSTSIVPLDNVLPKISTLSKSGATIEKIFLLTPNTPRIRNDLDHTVPIFPYIFERFS